MDSEDLLPCMGQNSKFCSKSCLCHIEFFFLPFLKDRVKGSSKKFVFLFF